MKDEILIVDAEIIFATLIKQGFTLDLIKSVSKMNYCLVIPEYIFEEIKRKEEKLLKYSKLELSKLWFVLFLILRKIEIIKKEEYWQFLEESSKSAPIEDIPYFALALKYKSEECNVKIWSNDEILKKSLENKVSVLTTKDMNSEVQKFKFL